MKRRKKAIRRRRKITSQNQTHQLLEDRRLLACATVYTPPGALSIVGTNQTERITVSVGAANIQVNLNTYDSSCGSVSFPTNSVNSISVQAGGGNDEIFYTNSATSAITHTLYGQDGNDRIYNFTPFHDITLANGGSGNDLINGGNGAEQLVGESGDDVINGGKGDDLIVGNEGDDELNGGEGNDSIGGMNGDDEIDGGSGNDTVNAGNDNDLVHGGTGNDTLNGGWGMDIIFGDAGDDQIDGETPATRLNAAGSADQLYGNEGSDTIFGGGGNDYIQGDMDELEYASNDTAKMFPLNIPATGGNDNLYGGPGNDHLVGIRGDDVLSGQDGNDQLDGGLPAPLVTGFPTSVQAEPIDMGNDTVSGGSGDDSISIYIAQGDHSVNGGSGLDRLEYWYTHPDDDTPPAGVFREYFVDGHQLPNGPFLLFDGSGIDQEFECTTQGCTLV